MCDPISTQMGVGFDPWTVRDFLAEPISSDDWYNPAFFHSIKQKSGEIPKSSEQVGWIRQSWTASINYNLYP